MADYTIPIKYDKFYYYDYNEGFKATNGKSNHDTVSGASLECLFSNNFKFIKDINAEKNY